jgi:hypothetical protein
MPAPQSVALKTKLEKLIGRFSVFGPECFDRSKDGDQLGSRAGREIAAQDSRIVIAKHHTPADTVPYHQKLPQMPSQSGQRRRASQETRPSLLPQAKSISRCVSSASRSNCTGRAPPFRAPEECCRRRGSCFPDGIRAETERSAADLGRNRGSSKCPDCELAATAYHEFRWSASSRRSRGLPGGLVAFGTESRSNRRRLNQYRSLSRSHIFVQRWAVRRRASALEPLVFCASVPQAETRA